MTISVDSRLYQTGIGTAGLSAFCHDLFCSFARSDQRRLGEMYVRGLVTVPGRKSVRRISDLVVGGGAEQRLQQFVNQSTWDWGPVRQDLAYRLQPVLAPQAWVIREVVFPKNGNHSVGVGRQFVPSAGRLLNCQRAIAVFLAGPQGHCPVNWRLILPQNWDDDSDRRERARVPEHERSLPGWHHALDALAEMVIAWGLPAATVVADIRYEQHVDPLVRGLDQLGLRYVLRVAENASAVTIRSGPTGPPLSLSFAKLLGDSVRRDTTTMSRWLLPASRPGGSQFVVTRIPDGARSRAPRYVAAERPAGRRSSPATWLTSLDSSDLPKLLELTALDERIDADLNRLDSRSGLRHFEGRSFPGWHHYVTLVSVAHGWSHLCQAPARDQLALC